VRSRPGKTRFSIRLPVEASAARAGKTFEGTGVRS